MIAWGYRPDFFDSLENRPTVILERTKMTTELKDKKCEPCEKGIEPLQGTALQELAAQLPGGWRVTGGKRLEKEYSFRNFREALAFTNRVGEIAEQEGHHPDINLTWGKVELKLSTHSIGGLSENDFILAAKIGDAE
jgi:4a-hydroxytetrahydrobiopterin dehydratase